MKTKISLFLWGILGLDEGEGSIVGLEDREGAPCCRDFTSNVTVFESAVFSFESTTLQ
jgi:hypothetical protein